MITVYKIKKELNRIANKNYCVGCGGCCKVIPLTKDINNYDFATNSPENSAFKNLKKITYNEACGLIPDLVINYKINDTYYFYTCPFFKNNLCDIHNNNKPKCCVDYPKYRFGFKDMFGQNFINKNCNWINYKRDILKLILKITPKHDKHTKYIKGLYNNKTQLMFVNKKWGTYLDIKFIRIKLDILDRINNTPLLVCKYRKLKKGATRYRATPPKIKKIWI